MPEEFFRLAAAENSDGIGVMSASDGVAKFVGRKATKKAWRYVRRLASAGVRHAVHFRYATHGVIDRKNCHPHKIPSGGWLMHNGILSAYAPAKGTKSAESDTAIFCETLYDVPETGGPERSAYWREIGSHIGAGNKLVVLHNDGKFEIVNASSGEWIDGVWYSQTYSLYPMNRWSNAWNASRNTDNEPDGILDLEMQAGDSYTDMLRRALERRYGVPVDPEDVHPDMLADVADEMDSATMLAEGEDYVLDTDGLPVRWSEWIARKREYDPDGDPDYSEYLNAAGMQ